MPARVVAAAGVMFVLTLTPAAADGGRGAFVTGAATSDGGVVGVSGGSQVAGTGGSLGGAGASTVQCRYFELADRVGETSTQLTLGAETTALIVGNRYWKVCVDTATGTQLSRDLIDPTTPDPATVARNLAQSALAQLRVQTPIARSNPANSLAVINIPTWLWVENWTPLTASATAAGVTATVTAEPLEMLWDPGDGSKPFTCTGPGVAYDLNRPARTQTTDCSFTYTRKAGRFNIGATQRWHLTYTATNGQAGDLGFVTSTTTIPIDVHELVTSIELPTR